MSLWIPAVSEIVAMNHKWPHKLIKISKNWVPQSIHYMWLVATDSTDMGAAHHHKNFCSRERREPLSVLSPESGTDASFLIYSIFVSSQSYTIKFKKTIYYKHWNYLATFTLSDISFSLPTFPDQNHWQDSVDFFLPCMTSFQVARSREFNIYFF